MKVYIPTKFDDIEFKDNDLVLIGIVTLLAERDGFDMWYNFHAQDVKKILGAQAGNVGAEGTLLNDLRKVFDLAVLNDTNWAFKFKQFGNYKYIPTRKGSLGKAKVEYRRLTDTRCISIFSYLLGRIHSDSGIFLDTLDLLPHIDGPSQLENWSMYKTLRFT